MTWLVGIDVGTSSCKAGVYDAHGNEIRVARVPMPWDEVDTGAEIDPQRLVDVAVQAVTRAVGSTPEDTIAGLGVTSMAETGILVDSAGTPVAPAIAWHDARGAEDAEALAGELGREAFSRRTGLRLRPLCSASKLRWLSRHTEGTGRARRWFNVAEWVVHGLGGRAAPELSLSSRTGWLDLASRAWWPAPLEACGFSSDLLAGEPVGAGTAMGRAGSTVDAVRGATLTVAGHDHLAAAVGVGATGDGEVFDSCGTAEAFIAPVAPPLDADTVGSLVDAGINVGWHAITDRLALLGAQRMGLALQRVLDLLGVAAHDFDAFDREAAETAPGSVWVAGLEDDEATIGGIGRAPSPAQAWRAAVDATTRRSRGILETIEGVTGPRRRLIVGGGWARSSTVRAAKQAQMGPIDLTGVDEPGCRGAALTAGIAAGVFADFSTLPDPTHTEADT